MPTDMHQAVVLDTPAVKVVVVNQTMFGGRDPQQPLGWLTSATSRVSWQHILHARQYVHAALGC